MPLFFALPALLAGCLSAQAAPDDGARRVRLFHRLEEAAELEDAVDLARLCPTEPLHPGLRVEPASVSAKNEGEGVDAARAAAYQKVVDEHCDGLSEDRCFAIKRNVAPYGRGHFDKRKKTACASVAFREADLEAIPRELAAMDAVLDDLAAKLAAAGGGAAGAVRLDEPVWAGSHCPTGELGYQLQSKLQGRLGQRVQQVDPGAVVPGMKVLRMKFAPGRADVTVTAELRDHGADTFVNLTLKDDTFSADLFREAEGEAGDCRGIDDLGLERDERLSDSGLRVEILVDSERTFFCEGESMYPALELNRPAELRLYTVDRNGLGYQVPSLESAAPTGVPISLGEWIAVVPPAGGDSRLVVAAVAPGGAFGSPAGAVGVVGATPKACRLNRALKAGAFPAAVALGTTSIEVLPATDPLCAGRSDLQRAQDALRDTEAVLAAAATNRCPSL